MTTLRRSLALSVVVLLSGAVAGIQACSDDPEAAPALGDDAGAADGTVSPPEAGSDASAGSDALVSPDAGSDASGNDASTDAALDADAYVETLADYYVDAVNGLDSNPGTKAQPFKTITHALSLPGDAGTLDGGGPGLRIQVAPGTYDLANGEVFPLFIPESWKLVGDEANRGGPEDGGTRIVGSADAGKPQPSAVKCSHYARVSGFRISSDGTPFTFGITVETDVTIAFNTFSNAYGGVAVSAGRGRINDNTFLTSSYGVRGGGPDSGPQIEYNEFDEMGLPLDLLEGRGVVRSNVIHGNGQLGIQVQAGDHFIAHNKFTRQNYTYACIQIAGGTPWFRENDCQVTSGNAIATAGTSAPDLGAGDGGGNILGNGDAAVGLKHESSANITATGNVWVHTPPTCGVDVQRGQDAGAVLLFPDGGGCP